MILTTLKLHQKIVFGMMFSRQQKGTVLTDILGSAQNFSEFTTCAKPACQAKVHNLDVTQWIQAS